MRTADEHVIEQLSRGIAAVFLGNANDLIAELRTIAEDSVHATITRDELITRLAARGFAMRRAVRPDSAAAMVADTTRRYLEGVRGKLIRRTLVRRAETALRPADEPVADIVHNQVESASLPARTRG